MACRPHACRRNLLSHPKGNSLGRSDRVHPITSPLGGQRTRDLGSIPTSTSDSSRSTITSSSNFARRFPIAIIFSNRDFAYTPALGSTVAHPSASVNEPPPLSYVVKRSAEMGFISQMSSEESFAVPPSANSPIPRLSARDG